MNPLEIRAKQLRAQMSRFGKVAPKVKVIKSSTPAIKYKSLGNNPLPWASKPHSPIKKKAVRSPFIEEFIKAKNGNDGITPKKGVDYLTPEEVDSLKAEILAEVNMRETPELEIDKEFVKKIVQIMHSLPENDKLEVSKGIRNASSFIYKGTKYGMEEMMHGGGSSSSAGVVIETPVGVVNAVNNVFTVTAEPLWVVSDGIQYFDGAGYVYAALTITLDVAPSQYIRDAISS